MMKFLVYLLLIFGLTPACQSPADSKHQGSKISDSLSFDVFLAKELLDWERLPEDKWMDPVFLINYNSRGLIEKEISFATNTWLQMDVDGNGALDEVGFLRSRAEGRVELVAFLRDKNGFEQIRLKDLGKIEGCCVAAGIDVIPPGEYFDIEKEKMINIPFFGLKYSVYNKAAFIYYFADGAFQGFQAID